MKAAVAVLALCACAAGLVGLQRSEGRHLREIEALREEMRALRKLAGQERPLTPLPALFALGAAARDASPPQPAPARAERPAPASPAPSAAETTARIEEAFVMQPGDPDWAGRTVHALEQALPAVLPAGSQVRSLSCRSSLCRLEMSHPDEAALERFQEQGLLAGPDVIWRGPMYATRSAGPGGLLATVTYLASAEADLPLGQ